MTVLGGDWRSVALEVIEQVAAATGRVDALTRILSTLQQHVDFDCASVVSLEGSEFLTMDKPDLCREAWAANAARYLDEGRPLFAAGIEQQGVVHDRDVLSARQRDHSTFYDEYMRPIGAKSCALLLVESGSSITQILSMTRTGASSFSVGDLHVLRMLRPAVSVAARVFPGVPRATRTMHAPPSPLAAREAEIVGYLVRGLQNAEIASCIGTSKNTVRNQIQRIFRKLEVCTRAELVAVVLANGWSPGLDEGEHRREALFGRSV
jgi:DNA-binding CsgD family transcriptional regulator